MDLQDYTSHVLREDGFLPKSTYPESSYRFFIT